MKKIIALGAVLSVLAPLATTGAFAGSWEVKEYPGRDKCYTVTHIAATYKINPKGIKVRGEVEAWSGEYKKGKIVKHTIHPAVYIQTKTLVESDYLSLVPTACKK